MKNTFTASLYICTLCPDPLSEVETSRRAVTAWGEELASNQIMEWIFRNIILCITFAYGEKFIIK
jgi:hypothetical protein